MHYIKVSSWRFLFLSSFLVLTFPLKAQQKDAHSLPKKKFIRFQLPRLDVPIIHMRISNIPEEMRLVNEFNRPNNLHQLSAKTKGSVVGFGFGTGLTFFERINLVYDLSFYINSYQGGRDTWSEIGFPSDDYLGYSLKSKLSDLSLALTVFKGEGYYVFLNSGIRFFRCKFYSGSDAFNTFDVQNSTIFNQRAFVFVVDLRF